MIIKLIQPKAEVRPMDTDLKARMAPSLGLLTIASILRKEHTVIIVNENVERIDFDEPADIVGITVTVDVLKRAAQISSVYRKKHIITVGGGIHITAAPESAAKYFDVLCIGMAEKTWPDIVKDYENNHLQKIYRCTKGIQGSEIAAPAYDLIDKRKYLYANVISTSRGCPFQCNFCYSSCEAYRELYINRPISDVIADIKAIGKKHVMFIDDNFIGNPQWTHEFLKHLRRLKIKWNAAVSANIVDMPKLMDEMKEAGCQSLFIGFESLSRESVSKACKSQNQVHKYEKLVRELHNRGIMINASFVFGLDGDDKTTFQTTLDWIIRNKIETVTSHILTPYPGTAFYEEMHKAGRITNYDYSRYNTAHVVFEPKNMTKEELYEGYLWMYRKIYSLKNIFRRMPRHQRAAYLLFNLFYRKYGRLTERVCRLITYEKIGYAAERISYGKQKIIRKKNMS